MQSHLVSELADHVLIRDAVALVAVGRSNTAALLVHLAEIEARRLYAAEHYPSMFAWCVGELHLSRDAAYRRLRAAGAARKFPALLPAIVDGRLHLSAIVLLAPCLTAANVDDLIAAATHKDREDIETLLAQRFPSPDVPTELSDEIRNLTRGVREEKVMTTASPPTSQPDLAEGYAAWRFTGETEFLFCLPQTDSKGVKTFTSQLVTALGRYWCHFGVATYPEDGTDAETLFNRAREACELSRQDGAGTPRSEAIA